MPDRTRTSSTAEYPAMRVTARTYRKSGGVRTLARLFSRALRSADMPAVVILVVLTAVAESPLLIGGTVVGQDTASFYYPWFGNLGEALRSARVPGWNPHVFSGTPFAADPQSGWMYLPAMVLFTLLPIAIAAKGYMLLHICLAGLAVYALARTLGMRPGGALVAAVAYEFSSYMYLRNFCCPMWSNYSAWLPLLLLGTERALRASGMLQRVLWCGVAGLAFSQTMAIFLGQGTYYALLALGGYLAYRTAIAGPDSARPWRARVLRSVTVGGGVLTFTFALGAAGLLPRLEYNALSNLAGGYTSAQVWSVPGWEVRDWARLVTPGTWYTGTAALALAIMAPILARERYAVPFWVALLIASLVVAGEGTTPLHSLLNQVLPRFAELHRRSPERVLVLLYLAAALLAGATVSRHSGGTRRRALAVLAPLIGALWLIRGDVKISGAGLWAVALVSVLVLLHSLLPRGKRAAIAATLLVVAADLFLANRALMSEHMADPGYARKPKVDLSSYYDPSGGAAFLQSAQRGEPSRYLGYAPRVNGHLVPYNLRWWTREAIALGVNNRSMMLGLHDVQGYNPVHLARYDEFMAAVNGREQEYHEANVYEQGLTSPLLSLLNVRHIVVPATTPPEWTEVRALERELPMVYRDGQVRIFENREALPRAWIVHSARQVRSGEALRLLSSGAVDPRQTALLEEPPPTLGETADQRAERAALAMYQPDQVRIRTSTAAPGLLVLSEVYYPAWKAYVDGAPAHLYVTDHALRAVAVPAGEHTVELRYESATLRVGLGITLAAYMSLLALAVSVAFRWTRKHIRHSSLRSRLDP